MQASQRGSAIRKRFDAIIFDCDGVLVDSEHVASRVIAELIGRFEPRVNVAHVQEALVGVQDDVIVDQIADEFGTRFPADMASLIVRTIDDALDLELRPIEGVRYALDRIGGDKAVASNSHAVRVRRSLSLAGIGQHFGEHVYTPETAGRPKPEPDIYLHAAACLGVKPARCLVVEDSPTGTKAGRAAGMTVIGFIGGSHVRPALVQHLRAAGVVELVDRMIELPRAIERLAEA